MKWLFLLALLALDRVGNAQIYFNQQLDINRHYEYLHDIVPLLGEGNLLFAGGEGTIFGVYVENFLLAKYSEQGELLWSKPFNLGTNEFGKIYGNAANMLSIDDDYSLVEGTLSVPINSTTYNAQQCFIKISNETGDTIWVKKHGLLDWEDSSGKLIRTDDGNFAIVGWSFKSLPIGSRSSVSLMKIDSIGNQVFRKIYTTDYNKNHFGWSLAQTPDGGYLLLCFTKYDGFCNGCPPWGEQLIEMVIFKTDADGKEEWAKTYPVWEHKQFSNPGHDITALADGNYLISGHKSYNATTAVGSNLNHYYFWTIDPDGEIIDSLSFGNHFNASPDRMLKISDGNYLVCGYELDTINKNGQTGLLLKVRPDGRPLWKREYRVSPPQSKIHDAFFNAVEMPDRGFVVCGRAYGPIEDSTYQNAWVIRVDSLGCLEPGCDSTITAAHGPPGPGAVGLSLSPNPTSGEVRLTLSDPEAVLLGVRVLDVQGRTVSDVQYLRSAGWRVCVLDLGGQPAGVYMVQVRTSKGWGAEKILKQ